MSPLGCSLCQVFGMVRAVLLNQGCASLSHGEPSENMDACGPALACCVCGGDVDRQSQDGTSRGFGIFGWSRVIRYSKT